MINCAVFMFFVKKKQLMKILLHHGVLTTRVDDHVHSNKKCSNIVQGVYDLN